MRLDNSCLADSVLPLLFAGSGLGWVKWGFCGLVSVLLSVSVSGFNVMVSFCFLIGLGFGSVWFKGSVLCGFVLASGLVWCKGFLLFSIFSNISVILDTELIFRFSPRKGLLVEGLVCTLAGLAGSVLSGLPGLGLVCKYFNIDE